MSSIVRPRFCQPCFECGEPVPTQRVNFLRSEAALSGRSLLKSDILCAEHGRERELVERAKAQVDFEPRRK